MSISHKVGIPATSTDNVSGWKCLDFFIGIPDRLMELSGEQFHNNSGVDGATL